MMNTLLPPSMLLAFVLASLVLAVVPGPAVLFIVTRTLSQGRMAGLASVAGVALGNFGNAVGASIGLAAIFAVSAAAFAVVKILGAGYLIYLGIKALRGGKLAATDMQVPRVQVARIFKEGFWVALLNPKTAIFFAAFLPQFLDAAAPTMAQSMVLGGLFVLIAGCSDTVYVLLAATLAPAMGRVTRGAAIGRYLSGAIFIGLGLFTAFSGNRTAK
jgi:threonine/homoserine/homoserine lactone efflux protein